MNKENFKSLTKFSGSEFDKIKEDIRQKQNPAFENSVECLATEYVYDLLYSKDTNKITEGQQINRNLNILERSHSDSSGYDMWSPLHFAIHTDNLVLAKFLLDNGAQINFQSQYSLSTPLHLAKNKKAYDFLLSEGANPTIRNASGWTPDQQFRSLPIKVVLGIWALAVSTLAFLFNYDICRSLEKFNKEKNACDEKLVLPLLLGASTIATTVWAFSGRPKTRVSENSSQSIDISSMPCAEHSTKQQKPKGI